MDWLDWLKAEGFLDGEPAAVAEALRELRQAQKLLNQWLPGVQARGLSNDQPCPVGLTSQLAALVGLQSQADLKVAVVVLLEVIRRLEHRIQKLESRD